MTVLFGGSRLDPLLREAAWIARCVGYAETAPLTEKDLSALASFLEPMEFEGGQPVFDEGESPEGVWIVRSGMLELATGSGRKKVIIQILYPGSVDGDIQLLLGMQLPYGARAVGPSRCLFLSARAFERLLEQHPSISRRWLSSVAARVSSGQARLIGMLGRSLPEQTARLLLDEQHAGRVPLPQRTLAAMLGVQRPSLNKVLKDLEKQGAIELGYAEIRVVDQSKLERVAPPGMAKM
ncbi:MAG: Crp/Fnr family transcriptional regulator [Actinomycetota bacterium]